MMAHLYFMDASNNTKKSTETIYEIKAPLATFDTIDLDDWEEDTSKKSPNKNEIKGGSDTLDKPEKGIQELPEQKTNAFERNGKIANYKESVKECKNAKNGRSVKILETPKAEVPDTVKEVETPTLTEETVQFDNISVSTLNSESENSAPQSGSGPSDLMDPNSSENNASAEEIQTKLKEKGRKHKEKATNVKYEKIDSFSDISDQEKSEHASPIPALRYRTKAYDSDSDSSDSDSGFIRTGFVSAAKSFGTRHLRTGLSNSAHGLDSVDSDSTPCGSPKVSRPVIPPPLSEEDAAKRSKKKAYEKRLQRLQVTTTPIERPRSTTPINIYALEEYVNISSPESTPSKNSLEKLKIKLPLEEIARTRSPRRQAKPVAGESGDAHVFNFNEELLFTHTKSAILLEEDGTRHQSPKRILVPPTLSPKLSPAHMQRAHRGFGQDSPNLPRYIYSPKSPRANKRKEENKAKPFPQVTDTEKENWAKFDEVKGDTSDLSEGHDLNKEVNAQFESDTNKLGKTLVNDSEASNEILKDKSKEFVANTEPADFESEEILTVKIEQSGDTTKCDIECHSANDPEKEWENRKFKENSASENDHAVEEISINENSTPGAIMLDDSENIESLC